MHAGLQPFRLFVEILAIVLAARLGLDQLRPFMQPMLPAVGWAGGLLDALLLLLLAGPAVFWRCLASTRRAARAVKAAAAAAVEGRVEPGALPVLAMTASSASGKVTTKGRLDRVIAMTAAAQSLGLVLTASVALWLNGDIEREARLRFEQHADHLQAEIERRFGQPLYGINGLRGMHEANGNLTGAQFGAFVSSRDLATEFPGIRGFGLIERVARADLDAFVAQQRGLNGAGPAFSVITTGDAAELYVIKHIEPLGANLPAWGFDVGSDPVRRRGVEQAVERGRPTLTGPVRLLQDASRDGLGFLYLVPLYRAGTDPAGRDQRWAQLVGLVYAPIVAAELLRGLDAELHGLVDFELLAGDEPAGGARVYGSRMASSGDDRATPLEERRDAALAAIDARPGALSLQRPLAIGGQSFLLRASTTAAFDQGVDRSSVAVAAAGGLMLSFAFALTVWLLGAGRVRAQSLAAKLTVELDRLATVARNTSNAVFVTDARRRVAWANEGFARVTGHPAEATRGATPKDLLSPGDGADSGAMSAFEAALDAGRGFHGELRARARDGRLYWLEIDLQPQHDAGGMLTGFVAIGTDTTDRRDAQERLESAVRETRALLDTLNLYAIVSVTDRSGRITEVNEAFCRISGYAREELVGQTHRILNSGAHPREFWKDMWRTIAHGQPWHAEVCNRAKDGSLYWVDNVVAPFMDASGRIEKYVSIRTDITALRHAAQALMAAKQDAEAASLAKSQFLANMSHEIRTPMNAVIGMLALLQRTELTPRQRDYAQKSEGAAHSLLGLLNDILDFSKVEAGKLALDPKPFRLDALLRDLSVILSANVGDKDVEVLYEVDPAVPAELVGDDLRLRQVLINLAGNAIKFTLRGEVVVSVRLAARDVDRATLDFAVRDTGIGIAPEHHDHIFAGFSQAEASTTRRFGGTGLGLAISRRLVGMMGGELRLDSAPGRGSTFSFRVSVPLPPADPSLEAPSGAPSGSADAPSPLHALVIDDNPTARQVLSEMARSLGWTVDLADSGEAAVAKLSARPPGVGFPYQAVFVDWKMPGLDGWETSRRLRELAAGAAAPLVVMVTAHGREMLERRPPSEQALLDAFLVKPVTASMLHEAVAGARGAGERLLTAPVARAMPLAGLHLLVVEDNANNRQVAQELLTQEGAAVTLAGDGVEGLDALTMADPPFDAVLMDLQMPVMDGFTATRLIRDDLGLHALPVIAMTANAMASDREACLAAGMDDHVGKPIDLAELVRVLHRHVGRAGHPESVDAAAPTLPTAEPVELDLDAALKRLGGDTALYGRAARLFLGDLETLPTDLARHLASPEHADAMRLLHTVKGLAATFGAMALSHEAASAERHLPAMAPEARDVLVHTVGQAAERARVALLAALRRLEAPAADAGDASAGPDTLRDELSTLDALLRDADLAALAAYQRLRSAHADRLGEALPSLDEAMDRLDFGRAQALCRQVGAALPAAGPAAGGDA